MTALYARSDHPPGWGYPGGRAHGYVIVGVRCDAEQVPAVSEAMRDFHGVGKQGDQYSSGQLGDWFGGAFDFVAALPYDDFKRNGTFSVIGDNRFVGFYEASDVLAQGKQAA